MRLSSSRMSSRGLGCGLGRFLHGHAILNGRFSGRFSSLFFLRGKRRGNDGLLALFPAWEEAPSSIFPLFLRGKRRHGARGNDGLR